MLLAGVGNMDARHKKNFFVVDGKTSVEAIEEAFKDLTSRRDLAMLLINQHVAEQIRHLVDDYSLPIPALLEVPSKDHPYDPDKDAMLQRVNRLFSQDD